MKTSPTSASSVTLDFVGTKFRAGVEVPPWAHLIARSVTLHAGDEDSGRVIGDWEVSSVFPVIQEFLKSIHTSRVMGLIIRDIRGSVIVATSSVAAFDVVDPARKVIQR